MLQHCHAQSAEAFRPACWCEIPDVTLGLSMSCSGTGSVGLQHCLTQTETKPSSVPIWGVMLEDGLAKQFLK